MRTLIVAITSSLTLLAPAAVFAQTATTAPTDAPAAVTGTISGTVTDATPQAAASPATTPAAAAGTSPTDRVVVTPEQLDLEVGQIDLEALTQEEELPFFVLDGYYRVRANWLRHPGLGVEDQTVSRYFQHRLRLEPKFNLNDKVVAKMQIDGLDNQIWGSNPGNVLTQSTADRFSNIILKRAWFDVTLPIGQLSAGRMPSNWGMGLLSNDGNGFRNTFGDAFNGSTFDRVQFGTKPLGIDSNWIVAVIYDKLVSDEPAGSVAGENTNEVNEVVGVVYFNTDPLKFGVYQLYRFQDAWSYQSDKRDATINATDGYFKLDLGLLYAETEQVWLYGRTNVVPVLSQATFTTSNPEVDIAQYGYAARVGLNIDPYGFEFEWGNATGDRNGFNDVDDKGRADPKVSNYKFNSDYNVGLLMFEHAAANFAAQNIEGQIAGLRTLEEQGIVSAETIEEVLTVTELALTNGSVTNAFYLNPKFRYSLLEGRITTTLGYLTAWANADTVIRQPGGNKKFNSYGHEVDLAADFQYTKNFVFGLQGGYLFAGDFFSRQDFITGEVIEPEDAALIQGRFTILF